MSQLPLTLTTATDTPALTVLSLGLGQDSIAMLYALVHDTAFAQRFSAGRLLVLSAETGDEHPQTNRYRIHLTQWCADHQIEYIHIEPRLGFHSPSWTSLRHFYRTHHTIGSKSYPAVCSSRLKLVPWYNYLEYWLSSTYSVSAKGKRGYYEFRDRYGPIRVLIGFSKGEESRRADPKSFPKWRQYAIEMAYPLIELGWTRQDCQQYTASLGYPVPPPSNCVLCPYMSKPELLWLANNLPDDYAEWVELENAKRQRWEHLGEKNYGVWGKKTLPMVLEEAQAQYGHLTAEELDTIKFSHGHAVKSKY